MPATESTWRDTGLLHRIFAIGGVVLTIATVWMFYKDHSRPWKSIQPTVVNIDLKLNGWRQEQFATTGAMLEHAQLSQAVSIARAQPLDADLLAQFKRQMETQREVSGNTDWIDQRAKDQAPLAAEAARLRGAAAAAQKASDAKPEDKELYQAAVKADAAALASEEQAGAARDRLIARLKTVIAEAKVREDQALGTRKFKSANIDAAKANLDIAIRDNLGQAEIARRQKAVDDLIGGEGGYAQLNEEYQRLADHRKELDKIVNQLTAEVAAAQKESEESRAGLERLKTQYAQQEETYFTNPFTSPYPWIFGKKILTLPILDAFGSPRKVENLWSEGLEQTYGSFGNVRRFDRCTTCHQSLAKSQPGAPTDPAYIEAQDLQLVVTPPPKEAAPKPRLDAKGQEIPLTTEDWLGLRLAAEGLLQRDDVTVSLVLPKSPAARAELAEGKSEQAAKLGQDIRKAVAQNTADDSEPAAFPTLPGLMIGDVITGINGSPLLGGDRGPRRVGSQLRALAKEGKPIALNVRRGLPNPYISHPRLDLYVSDSSPHRMQTFACTVCHDGQGSATEFKFASHSPNTTLQADRWAQEHGWFDNHHWIFPMNPARFAESSCLKCHHEVVDLEPSEKFPQPPAPKVTHGYQLLRKYGCYGCHEINGFDGPTRRIGPDLRMEPNYFASAQALLPLLPARLAHYDAIAEQLSGATAPIDEQIKAIGAQRAMLNEQKTKLDPAAADNAEQTAAIDAELAKLDEEEKTLRESLGPQGRDLALARQHRATIEQVARLAAQLAAHPELDAVRHEIQETLDNDVRLATENKDKPLAQQEWITFDERIHGMAGWFKDQEAPGDQRKPGPSLRYLAAKVDRTFLYDWLHDPTHFRPTTRMPKFFGLWDHLKNEQGEMTDPHAPQLEPIEIRGMVEFLMAQSAGQLPAQNGQAAGGGRSAADAVRLYEPLAREPGIDPWTDEEKVARGKVQFQTRGCLACHTHQDFPDVAKYRGKEEIVQGPDLSNVGDKFSAQRNPSGPDWLYSWIKEPTRYHARTVMPNVFLGPETDPGSDAMSTDDDKTFDPADDVTNYLLASTSNWKPVPEATRADQPLDESGLDALQLLTLEYLNEAFYKEDANDYYVKGIPPELEGELKGAEKDLIVEPGQSLSDTQRLQYIGRKTIAKYGCFGCHDIPGFEDAKPIGTGLADWGRKDPARLAFEHITHYVEGHGHGGHAATHDPPASPDAAASHEPAATSDAQNTQAYYHHALAAGNRIGFIQQKLKEPRSYDFEKTENKRYNERLRMPQFPFSLEEREAVITFVLGLVADPPREKYVFTPNPRSEALIAGRQVLEKYNCGGCHILGLEKWKVSYAPEAYGPQASAPTFPFVLPEANPKQLKAQATPDARNLLHSELIGLHKVAKPDGLPDVADAEGLALDDGSEYLSAEQRGLRLAIDLFQPAIVDGHLYAAGQSAVPVPMDRLQSRSPAWGGVLTQYLLPEVTALEKLANPNASGSEAYGWLPPPLMGEGEKVQASWLHDFLLEPYPIRPATFLRMPKFNMSSEEATALVNYFAAVDNADYPYEMSSRRLSSELAAQAQAYGQALDEAGVEPPQSTDELVTRRFDDAMQIVVDGNYCVKCHKVSDFDPAGRDRAKAPNLADVYRRLKPDYLRRWIANPKIILPYTSMPENVKYDPSAPHLGGVSQDLYHGTSIQQVDGLVDLLMNYDQYTRGSRKVAEMVKPATIPAEGAPPAEVPAAEAPAAGAAAEGPGE